MTSAIWFSCHIVNTCWKESNRCISPGHPDFVFSTVVSQPLTWLWLSNQNKVVISKLQTLISYDNIESENEKENKFYNLFFVISDELYNYIFSFKNIFILSDIYIQYLHAMFLLTLLYVTNITSRMWKCMGDIVSKHSSNTKSTSLFTCWPLGRIRTNFWTICETIFDYWE